MKWLNYIRRATTKTPFPRSIFSSAILSSDANNQNSCLHKRKDFRCCRSHCQIIVSREEHEKKQLMVGEIYDLGTTGGFTGQ
jgi:hypothetical protein